ncbi:C40 family peptidase [Streptomyces sp. JNUCC 63]
MIADSSVHYTVRQGDWLSKIAPRLSMSWQQLYKDNREIIGSNPDVIYPGTVLNVRPAATSHQAKPGSAAPHAAEPAPIPQTSAGAVAVAYARSKIGAHYHWRATGPTVFDCSGLVYAAWRKAGVTLPRTAKAMWNGVPRRSSPPWRGCRWCRRP